MGTVFGGLWALPYDFHLCLAIHCSLAPEHAAGYFEHAEQYEEIFKRDKIAEELESDLIDSDDENGQN
ncbi:unnamed protein product [Didymodactylos carnosus]|uniref:Uncharacterized protein n=1 Tax=Didymodactylos carnosus TaxID=1234261 RepID=A0A8S2HAN8_9BILA|nr:unnamed protein product [Didymodactylos carnosus]CAF3613872.1 unnamed protein product [Didymodactylos carnosus]